MNELTKRKTISNKSKYCWLIPLCIQCSVRPKPLFWFRSETETQNGWYFPANTVTSWWHQNFLVIDIMEFFSTIKGPKKPNFLQNIKYFCRSFQHKQRSSVFSKVYLARLVNPGKRKVDPSKQYIGVETSLLESTNLIQI